MMICKVDFEEIFPEMFKPEQSQVASPNAPGPRTPCSDRWEDDGGRTHPNRRKLNEMSRE